MENQIESKTITLDQRQKKINDQAETSKNDMLWGKPANDILNGRDNSVSAKPIRAIWEMVQNARDVSSDKCHIVFTRKNGNFEFKHDGMPFTNDTINALILQTSAKPRNDGDQVGQYGTGFLTTHKFGRKFILTGSLKLVDDEELYYNFPELVVDRTPNTKEEMVKSLSRQFETTEGWRTDQTYRNIKPNQWTIFNYLQPNTIEASNVKDAFEVAPEVIPYVLCLNESIESITLSDELVVREIVISRKDKQLKGKTELAHIYSTPISVLDSKKGPMAEEFEILTLESIKTVVTKKGIIKPMVTVVVPVRNNTAFKPSDDIARLFMYLPLVGTEQWGINFIFHAPLFTCASDDRSSLRLVLDGQTEDDPAENNRTYIEEATNIVFEYINAHLTDWSDVHYLAPVDFDVTNANKELSSYYKSLKNKWIDNLRGLELVSVQTRDGIKRIKPSAVFVLDSTLSTAIKENNDLLEPIHKVLSQMHKDEVPTIALLTYWSDVFAQWYDGEKCNQIISIGDIVDFIADKGLSVVSEDELLKICEYLRNSEQLSFFDKNILLTESGTLTNKTEGYESETFCSQLKSCIKVLLPEFTNNFVKSDFANLVKLAKFEKKDIKAALSPCTESLQTSIKTVADAAKNAWDMKTASINKDGLLSEEQRNALMDYCRMVIPRNGTSFQANALQLIAEFYGHAFDFGDTIDADFYEWRGAIRTLLCNALVEYSLLEKQQQLERLNWVKSIISCIFVYSDFNGILQNYRIYLSQKGEFCYSKDLKKDPGIPEKMKEIYNAIASSEGNSVDVHKDLFDVEFGKIAQTDASYDVVVFGKDIMDLIHKSGKYLNEVDSYEHRDLIMDIINNFDNEEDGVLWRSAFEKINSDIPSLLAKLVLNEDNREPMIKIMKVKDKTRLNKAAEIINDENLISIWELGKDAWVKQQNEKRESEKKKELGSYVESYLLNELRNELTGNELKVEVDDVQGGQDIIVSINGTPIYYIEVKSRWVSADSVLMTATQLERSVEKKDCYSLFAVDMVGYNGENVKEHIYPDSMDEFVKRIRVLTEIGTLNEEIIPKERDPENQVHLGGDYKAVVPQNLIRNKYKDYIVFLTTVLKPRVIKAIKDQVEQSASK